MRRRSVQETCRNTDISYRTALRHHDPPPTQMAGLDSALGRIHLFISHPRPTRYPDLTGLSVRAAEQSSSLGKPSTCPLVRPASNHFRPARCRREPVIEQCETLPTGARSSSSSSERLVEVAWQGQDSTFACAARQLYNMCPRPSFFSGARLS